MTISRYGGGMTTMRDRKKGRSRSLRVRRKKALAFNQRMIGLIFSIFASKHAATLAGCADCLNDRGLKTIWGRDWSAVAVRRVLAAHGHTSKSLNAALETWARAKLAPLKCRRSMRSHLFHLIDAAMYYPKQMRDGSIEALAAVHRHVHNSLSRGGGATRMRHASSPSRNVWTARPLGWTEPFT